MSKRRRSDFQVDPDLIQEGGRSRRSTYNNVWESHPPLNHREKKDIKNINIDDLVAWESKAPERKRTQDALIESLETKRRQCGGTKKMFGVVL